MLVVRLRKKEEFQKVCKGRTVFFLVDNGSISYFSPAQVNETEMLYVFYSRTPLPFREHHDLEDEEGILVWQLIEIDGLSYIDVDFPCNIVNPGLHTTEERAEVY